VEQSVQQALPTAIVGLLQQSQQGQQGMQSQQGQQGQQQWGGGFGQQFPQYQQPGFGFGQMSQPFGIG
jgi:hypothetical protein